MYAHVDGKSTVGVGVDFCHVRPDYFGKVFVVPLVNAGAEEGHQGRRVKFPPGGGSPGDHVLQFGLPEPQPIQFGLKFRHDQTGQHRLNAVRDLLLYLGQLCLLCFQIRGGAVDLVGDILGRGCEVHRPQVFLQVLDDESLNFVGVDILRPAGMRPVFIATAIVPGDVALLVRAGMAHIPGTTFFTFDQTRQQVLVAGFIFCVPFVVLHSGLHLLPCFVVNDPRDRALYALYVGICLAACPLPHDLVLLLVPGIDADIPLILQYAVQAVLSDRAAPLAQSALQAVDDIVVAFSGGVPGENVPDDPGLCRIDHVLAVDDVIAKGREAAQEGTLLRLDGDAVDGLLPGAQDFSLAHTHGDQFRQKVGAVGQVAQLLAAGADHLYAQIHHCLPEGEPVAHVTGAAGNVVNDHGVEILLVRCGHQSLETLPVGIGAAGCFVLETGDDLYIVFSGVLPDPGLLVGYAVFGLVIGRIPHIFRSLQNAES